jgi:hypothetical protein
MGGSDEAATNGVADSSAQESGADEDRPEPAPARKNDSVFGQDSGSTGAGGGSTATGDALESAAPPSPTFQADLGAVD